MSFQIRKLPRNFRRKVRLESVLPHELFGCCLQVKMRRMTVVHGSPRNKTPNSESLTRAEAQALGRLAETTRPGRLSSFLRRGGLRIRHGIQLPAVLARF